jgi:hypothetical protein
VDGATASSMRSMAGEDRARPDRRSAPPLIHSIPDPLRQPVPLRLRRQRGRTPGEAATRLRELCAAGRPEANAARRAALGMLEAAPWCGRAGATRARPRGVRSFPAPPSREHEWAFSIQAPEAWHHTLRTYHRCGFELPAVGEPSAYVRHAPLSA